MVNRVLVTSRGRVIVPIDQLLGNEGPDPDKVGTIYSDDGGRSWKRSPIFGPPPGYPTKPEGIGEPAVVELANGKMWMVCRGLGGHLWQAWSDDGGATWCTPSPTTLISPLSAVNAKRIPGSDAVIVFWNHARPGTSTNWNDVNNFWRPRSPLVFAISKDNCRSWSRPVTVTPGTATYPAICFLGDKMYVEFWEDPDPKALYGNPKSHLILLAYDVAALLRFAGQPIAYIQKDVPTIDLPAYPGDRYEAVVPDTLDLAERAALAINGLTGPLDPMADYELYWRACFHHNPPIMGHDFNDHVQAKFHESLPLMRLISGSHQNEEVDTRWMQVVMQMQGPDGLLYYPLKGRPWAKTEVYLGTDRRPRARGDHYTEPFHQRAAARRDNPLLQDDRR